MAELTSGDKAPDFELPADGERQISLSDLKNQAVILYFYPRDDTSGCTREAIDFTELRAAFDETGAEIIGVSADTVAKHDKFKAKHKLNVTLVSDEEKQVIRSYGVWVEKNMYGRKYMGIERATFLISPDGRIAKIWRKVKVKGHAAEVLEATRAL